MLFSSLVLLFSISADSAPTPPPPHSHIFTYPHPKYKYKQTQNNCHKDISYTDARGQHQSHVIVCAEVEVRTVVSTEHAPWGGQVYVSSGAGFRADRHSSTSTTRWRTVYDSDICEQESDLRERTRCQLL